MNTRIIGLGGQVGLFVLLTAAGLGGCSANAESADRAGAGGTSGGALVNLNRGGATGGSALALGGSAALALGGSAGTATGVAGSTNASCSAETREAQRVPLDMYFLVDSSGSMADDVPNGNKWELVSGALIDFLNAPANSDLGSGLGYFPLTNGSSECSAPSPTCVCDFFNNCYPTDDDASCVADDYAHPAVPLALTSNSAAIVADLQAHWVDGSTPTRPALEGAMEYLNAWASQHPQRKSVLVLTTDGEPTDCYDNTPADVAAVAADALSGPNAIRTFVIGVGDSLDSLDAVARAGGTDQAILVDTNGDVTKDFTAALDRIRGAAASCDFTIPTQGSAGQKIDPHQVNVRYTPTQSATPTLIPQIYANDPKNCDSGDGWYYDNATAPTLIRLCPTTCQAMSGGSIAVEFGCDTVVQPPR